MLEIDKSIVLEKLKKLGDAFIEVLNNCDPKLIKKLVEAGYQANEAEAIILFDWFQGVGLYGFFKLYDLTKNREYVDVIKNYYQKRIANGLPPKNVNSTAPMLTLCFLNEIERNPQYDALILDWANYVYHDLPRTEEGGFQHTTWESDNAEQLWDDTLFMAVLFMLKVGIMYQKNEYVEAAIYQFLIHQKYLFDKKTGLWFHGFNFAGRHNYAEALWARGNSWITVFIPEFLEIISDYQLPDSTRQVILNTLDNQVKCLANIQDGSGLWHTLLDDKSAYLEASAAAGFGFGILKSVRKGYLDESYQKTGLLALKGVMECINDDGILTKVSGGTRMGETKKFYKEIVMKSEPYGQALAMLILIEALYHGGENS